ncbi:hypothetical protein POTOM_058523 [Populus tomentosa]|uniref:Uncharacterized protein n=1 Tax=Populus tomentosa TaxID=118781 RepID=A0A8X7XVX0_POPTO|nr:hypothetical protein POTOM_058523 [Populus tomentosa]
MESLIQMMDLELQFQMVGIHALQQLAALGFEHLKMKEINNVQSCNVLRKFLDLMPINYTPESEFIEKIVGDVLEKLHAMSSSGSIESCYTTAGLFGIDVRVSKVEFLLNINSPDVLIIGIWGMGGIGKTTIAEVVCNKVRSRFEGIFFANFRHQSDLQRSFLSQLLGQEILNRGLLSFRDPFVRDRLRRKKLFIVLDDVHNSMALEEWGDLLDGRNSSFGPGSKVLITSRDKQVLNNVVVDETYEVEGLDDEEAIQLFSSKALKNCIPTVDQMHLIEQIARHVQGNPLALKVLGSSLYGKSIEEWRSALNKLAQHPQIERALRISYDGLDSEQKSIFLDIAHFLKGLEPELVTRMLLDGLYDRCVKFDISTLIDKCLITETYCLEMHDLLQEMAFNIVRAESDFPGERSWLCHPPDVVQVLEENKGTRKIKGISLNMSDFSGEIHLKSDAFAMMDGLRFLLFYRVFGEIHLPPTGLEYLSNELRYLQWDGFPSKSLPPSFRAEHLVELDLGRSKLVKLWTGVKDVGNLRAISLSGSPYLTELPDLSMAKNLESLRLAKCSSLTEVPSSLQYLDKLEEVDLCGCYNLRSFPMLDSKVLKYLSISRCLDVTTCPTISQNMTQLKLEQTSIKEVPQSVTGNLFSLSLSGCREITKFPEISGDITILNLRGTAIKEVSSSIQFLTRLKTLKYLDLGETGIKELPLSIKDMVCLEQLTLSRTPIKELPELPPSLKSLRAHDCASLKTVTSTINIGLNLDFRNCFELDQKQLIEAMHLKIQSGERLLHGTFDMVLPGSEIPEWFGYKGIGSSVTIQLPSNCRPLKGIAFCLVFLGPLPFHRAYCDVKCKNDEVHSYYLGLDQIPTDVSVSCDSYHMILHYKLHYFGSYLSEYSGNEVTFNFYNLGVLEVGQRTLEVKRWPLELKSWGVCLHFDENIPADKKFKRKFCEI